jgi:hypothetical protein
MRVQKSDGRYRFTVAHEIGHWSLHRGFILAALDAPDLFSSDGEDEQPIVSYRRSVFPSRAEASRSREEYQANRFAISLLVNPAAVREEMIRRFDTSTLSREKLHDTSGPSTLDDLARKVAKLEIRGVPALKDLFGVSAQAMAIILKEHGFVSEAESMLN